MNIKFFKTYLRKELKGILPSHFPITDLSFARDKEQYHKKVNGIDFDVVNNTLNLENSYFSINVSVTKDVSFIMTLFYDWETKKPLEIILFTNGGSLYYYGYMYFYKGSFQNLKVNDFERYIQFLKVLLKIKE